MKLLLIVLGILLFFVAGCKKDETKSLYFGSATATINSVSWKATKVRCSVNQPCYKGKLGVEFLKHNSQGYLREKINFSIFTPELGQKNVYPLNYQIACNDTLQGTYSTVADHGDVSKDFYNATASDENYLKIDKYNAETKELWGTFHVTYIISLRQDPTAPDTVRITDGKFYTKIFD